MTLTTRKDREASLIGWDAAKYIRQARKELVELAAEGRRRAEVDGAGPAEAPHTFGVLVFEEKGGWWRLETLDETPFPGADGRVVVRRQREDNLMPAFRWAMVEKMAVCRYAREDAAKDIMRKAVVLIHGRVLLKDEDRG